MKKLVEVNDEGLVGLMGKRVTLMCMNYFYLGTLEGVNDHDVLLTDPSIVYDTGSWTGKYSDSQRLHGDSVYVRLSAVEAYGELGDA